MVEKRQQLLVVEVIRGAVTFKAPFGRIFLGRFFDAHPTVPNPKSKKTLQVPWTILPALQSFSRHRGRWGRDASFWSGDVGSQEELLSLTIPLETCCGKELELHHLM